LPCGFAASFVLQWCLPFPRLPQWPNKVAVAAERVAEALAVEGREAAVPVVEVLAAAALAVDKTAADRVAAAERNPPSMMVDWAPRSPKRA
jgi:hypothetical protein